MKKRVVSMILGCMAAVALFTSAVSAEEAKDTITAAYTYKAPLDPFDYPTDITKTIFESLIRYDGLKEEDKRIQPLPLQN